jgi:hypothetical protein
MRTPISFYIHLGKNDLQISNFKPLTNFLSLNSTLFPLYPCTIAMVLQVGSRVAFLAKHLPGTLKAAIAQQLNVDNIATE